MAAPPFQLTPKVVASLGAIERLLGRAEGLGSPVPSPQLRRKNRVRTVRGSVAIEGNRLSEPQVTALLDGKRVAGEPREILEVQNAISAYALAPRWKPGRVGDLLAAHRALTHGLLADAGRWRRGAVGVMSGSRVKHVAPPAYRVDGLVRALLRWVHSAEVPVPVKACVAHYELQFIHPFSDGNGRVGRLWQHVTLLAMSPVFAWLPVESVIRERQRQYYAALARSDRAGDSTPFLEFSLGALVDELGTLVSGLRPARDSGAVRLDLARAQLSGWFTRADYLAIHRGLAPLTASRDLALGVKTGMLERRGERRLARYRFASQT